MRRPSGESCRLAGVGVLGGADVLDRVEAGVDDLGLDVLLEDAVQAGAALVAAEEDLILVRSLADEADLSHVGTGATIGAAGHANDNLFILQTIFFQQRLNL